MGVGSPRGPDKRSVHSADVELVCANYLVLGIEEHDTHMLPVISRHLRHKQFRYIHRRPNAGRVVRLNAATLLPSSMPACSWHALASEIPLRSQTSS
jgi:hypothetical protein